MKELEGRVKFNSLVTTYKFDSISFPSLLYDSAVDYCVTGGLRIYG